MYLLCCQLYLCFHHPSNAKLKSITPLFNTSASITFPNPESKCTVLDYHWIWLRYIFFIIHFHTYDIWNVQSNLSIPLLCVCGHGSRLQHSLPCLLEFRGVHVYCQRFSMKKTVLWVLWQISTFSDANIGAKQLCQYVMKTNLFYGSIYYLYSISQTLTTSLLIRT